MKWLNILKSFKSIAILFLVILAVYQTGQLWFVNITNRNFFYNYFASIIGPISSGEQSSLVSPYRIMTGYGDETFTAQCNGLQNAESKQYSDSAIIAALKNGMYQGSETVNYASLLTRAAYIYEYACSIPADIFARGFGQRSNALTTRGIEYVNQVIIIPPDALNTEVKIIFINQETAFEYTLPQSNKQESAALYNHALAKPQNVLFYTFKAPYVFIPQWPENGLRFQPVTTTNPYTNIYGEKLIYFIQNRLDMFFDNPTTTPNGNVGDDGVYTYSNASVVVRYYDRDILEYTNYRGVDRSGTFDFLTDYNAARNFIDRDPYIVNEMYLSGYQIENDQHTFYFDYVINDMPLIMPTGWPSQAENGHPVEITVDHETVVKYKKLVYNFHIDENARLTGRVTVDDLENLQSLQLGYKMEDRKNLLLYWFVETDETCWEQSVTTLQGR